MGIKRKERTTSGNCNNRGIYYSTTDRCNCSITDEFYSGRQCQLRECGFNLKRGFHSKKDGVCSCKDPYFGLNCQHIKCDEPTTNGTVDQVITGYHRPWTYQTRCNCREGISNCDIELGGSGLRLNATWVIIMVVAAIVSGAVWFVRRRRRQQAQQPPPMQTAYSAGASSVVPAYPPMGQQLTYPLSSATGGGYAPVHEYPPPPCHSINQSPLVPPSDSLPQASDTYNLSTQSGVVNAIDDDNQLPYVPPPSYEETMRASK